MIWNKIYLRLSASFLVLLLALLLAWLGHTKPAHGMEFPLVYTVEGEAPQPVLAPTLEELKKPVVKKSKPKLSVDNCNCVSLVKARTGFSQSIGLARNWPTGSPEPVVGGVIVTDGYDHYGNLTGHVALIIEVKENTLIVEDVNYKKCQHTIREVPIKPANLIGFWRP